MEWLKGQIWKWTSAYAEDHWESYVVRRVDEKGVTLLAWEGTNGHIRNAEEFYYSYTSIGGERSCWTLVRDEQLDMDGSVESKPDPEDQVIVI